MPVFAYLTRGINPALKFRLGQAEALASSIEFKHSLITKYDRITFKDGIDKGNESLTKKQLREDLKSAYLLETL